MVVNTFDPCTCEAEVESRLAWSTEQVPEQPRLLREREGEGREGGREEKGGREREKGRERKNVPAVTVLPVILLSEYGVGHSLWTQGSYVDIFVF